MTNTTRAGRFPGNPEDFPAADLDLPFDPQNPRLVRAMVHSVWGVDAPAMIKALASRLKVLDPKKLTHAQWLEAISKALDFQSWHDLNASFKAESSDGRFRRLATLFYEWSAQVCEHLGEAGGVELERVRQGWAEWAASEEGLRYASYDEGLSAPFFASWTGFVVRSIQESALYDADRAFEQVWPLLNEAVRQRRLPALELLLYLGRTGSDLNAAHRRNLPSFEELVAMCCESPDPGFTQILVHTMDHADHGSLHERLAAEAIINHWRSDGECGRLSYVAALSAVVYALEDRAAITFGEFAQAVDRAAEAASLVAERSVGVDSARSPSSQELDLLPGDLPVVDGQWVDFGFLAVVLSKVDDLEGALDLVDPYVRAIDGSYPPERRRELEAMGFRVETKDLDGAWARFIEALLAYKAEHGHCDVPMRYVTTDGLRLGPMCHRARQAAKRPSYPAERRRELEAMGFRLETINRHRPSPRVFDRPSC